MTLPIPKRDTDDTLRWWANRIDNSTVDVYCCVCYLPVRSKLGIVEYYDDWVEEYNAQHVCADCAMAPRCLSGKPLRELPDYIQARIGHTAVYYTPSEVVRMAVAGGFYVATEE